MRGIHKHRASSSHTPHAKLHGPDWFVSGLMLERTLVAIAKRLKLNRDYHVPYLAGYSTDGTTVYIDRDLPRWLVTRSGRRLDVDRYLMMHEGVEKALIGADGFGWREYDKLMQQYIKEVEEAKPLHLPPDLDLKPYIDEHDSELLAQMRRWIAVVRKGGSPVPGGAPPKAKTKARAGAAS